MSRISKWMPDRKVWTGGVLMIASYVIATLSNSYFDTGFGEMEVFFGSLALGKLVEYILPPSIKDIIKRIDNDIVAIAGASTASEVSGSVARAAIQAGADPARVAEGVSALRASGDS